MTERITWNGREWEIQSPHKCTGSSTISVLLVPIPKPESKPFEEVDAFIDKGPTEIGSTKTLVRLIVAEAVRQAREGK